MTKTMLIDASQPEENRVAVVEDNKLKAFEFESITRKQLKGNIYLAKVTRVEPSLQAAFVEYGGNRQGFLPFSEIHPDYYRIPVEDRDALLAEEAEIIAQQEAAAEAEEEKKHSQKVDNAELSDDEEGDAETGVETVEKDNTTETAGEGDDDTTLSEREQLSRRMSKLRRRYKIQEVIESRQIILIQVVKEERGNKGAAVTTYLSLPGRYCVLMPNSPRSGGVSRKISNQKERRKLKETLAQLDVPTGMSVILRTAGLSRKLDEIKRDLAYLQKLWDQIRKTTLESTAPALINEESDLCKRAVRDLYDRDMDQVLVSGGDAYKRVKEFIKLIIPADAKKIKQYKEQAAPLFHKYQLEGQISRIFNTRAELPSGGYIIINPTEALVSIDVNSGRATRERNVDDMALKTNLEAAEEVARQLRLRDLGGLVVIDFIDMETNRHNIKVERRLKECMSNDRARIEIGRISAFGLLELSRQRLNPSLGEAHFECCAACQGTGMVRTTDSAALVLLRAIEEECIRGRAQQVIANVHSAVAVYILNKKRSVIADIEERYGLPILIHADDKLSRNDYRLEYMNDGKKVLVETAFDLPGERPSRGGKGNRNKKRQNNRHQNKSDNHKPEMKAKDKDDKQKPASKPSKEPQAQQPSDDDKPNSSSPSGSAEKKEASKPKAKKAAPKKTAKPKAEKADADAGAEEKAVEKTKKPAKKASASKKPSTKKAPAKEKAAPANDAKKDDKPKPKKKGWWSKSAE